MTLKRRNLLKAGGLFVLPTLANQSAEAQTTFPNQPVKIVVPYPPGGITDISARSIGAFLQTKWKQPVIIDNRPGASGSIGAEYVAKSPPDGHTLLLALNAMLLSSMLDKDIRYSLTNDFEAVTLVATTPMVLVAPASLGAQKTSDLKALLQADQSKAAYATIGVGSSLHLYGNQLAKTLGVDAIPVPMKGGAAIVTELVGGRVGYSFLDIMGTLPMIQSGQIKALGVIGDKRSPALPNVPTLAEQGIAGFETRSWFAFYAPRGTPSRIVDKLSADIGEAIRSKDVHERLVASGNDPAPGTPQDMRAFVATQVTDWKRLAASAGMAVK